MGDLSTLLSELEWTCKQLEKIKDEQCQDQEQIAQTFEKTILSILDQKEDLFSQVEAEDKRLRDQLCSIKDFNHLAFQEGIAEITSLAEEIFRISSQIKQALATSNHSETTVRKIKERVSTIFRNRNTLDVNFKGVYFSPYPIALHTLGEIRSVEQTFGFSITRPAINCPTSVVKEEKSDLISAGKPQWENTPENSFDPENIRVKSEDGNDDMMVQSLPLDDQRPDKVVIEVMEESERSASPADNAASTCICITEFDLEETTGIGEMSNTTCQSFQLTAKDRKIGIPDISSSVEKWKMQTPQLLKSKNLHHARCYPQNCVSNVTNQPLSHAFNWNPALKTSLMQCTQRPSKPTKYPSELFKSSSAISPPSDASQEVKVCEHSVQKWKKSGIVPHQLPHKGLSRRESSFMQDLTEHGATNKTVKQFGKFGSGRAGLNLPSSIHASAMGTLYIIDNGNHRLQVVDIKGRFLQQIPLRAQSYFDVAVNNQGFVALTNLNDRIVEIYNRYGRFLQAIYMNWEAPRGIAVDYHDEFIVADMNQGVLKTLTLESSTGDLKKCTVIPGFNHPYYLNANRQGLLVLSERGYNGPACVKVLSKDCKVLKVLGLQDNSVPPLHNLWGVCIDNDGGVLVAGCEKTPYIVYYPPTKPARCIVTEGLHSPKGLALWQDHFLVVADSMSHCIKVFYYQ